MAKFRSSSTSVQTWFICQVASARDSEGIFYILRVSLAEYNVTTSFCNKNSSILFPFITQITYSQMCKFIIRELFVLM